LKNNHCWSGDPGSHLYYMHQAYLSRYESFITNLFVMQ